LRSGIDLMKIKFLGHACFLITSSNGTKIINDPYEVSKGVNYGEINESADIVTVSHDHFDHNNVSVVKGNPHVIKGAGDMEIKGIPFHGISAFHDNEQGNARGKNAIYCFEVDGIQICHLGDIGHTLSEEELDDIGRVDVLIIPVGGYFTIDAQSADYIAKQIQPKVIIPMHYKTSKCDFPITGVDDFLDGKENIRHMNSSEVDFKAGKLPDITEIVVLDTAL